MTQGILTPCGCNVQADAGGTHLICITFVCVVGATQMNAWDLGMLTDVIKASSLFEWKVVCRGVVLPGTRL